MLFITRSFASVLCLGMLSSFALKGMEARRLHPIYVSKDHQEEPYLSARKYLLKKLTNINLLNKRSDDSYGEVSYDVGVYLNEKSGKILNRYDEKRASAYKYGIVTGLAALVLGGTFGWAVQNDQPKISTAAFWTCVGSSIGALTNLCTFFSMPHRTSISDQAIITNAMKAKIEKKKLEIAYNQNKLDLMNLK